MISPIIAFGGQLATAGVHDHGFAVQSDNQAIQGALASVGPNTDPVKAAQFDKAMALKGAQDRLNFNVSQAMQEGNEEKAKKAAEHARRMSQ